MKSNNNAMAIRIVLYKVIVDGDLRKFTATSNDKQNGGGARDLRFSPAKEFFPIFQRMFGMDAGSGIVTGTFSWANHADTEAEIHPPTNSRPNEVRIGRIHECFPKEIIPQNAQDCILLVVLDVQNKVWCYFTSRYSLMYDNWHPKIKDNILAGLDAIRPARTTAMGFIDIENGRSYTNGK